MRDGAGRHRRAQTRQEEPRTFPAQCHLVQIEPFGFFDARRTGFAHHKGVAARADDLRERFGILPRLLRVFALERHADEVRIRRVMEGGALLELLLRKGDEIFGPRQFNGGRFRRGGLHDDRTGLDAAADPARHLRDELEGAFGGAEIGDGQADIGVENPGERHIRKIEPLGDHLRPDENVGLPGAEPSEDFLVGSLARRDIQVHALNAGGGEEALRDGLDALGAETAFAILVGPALRTDFRLGPVGTAEVAAEHLVIAVIRHADGAVFARLGIPACRAGDGGRIAAAVQEEHHLLAGIEAAVDFLNQHIGKERTPAAGRRPSQRQQRPSTTCSLARTVLSCGHQFTVDTFLYTSPRL